ncbi:LysR substrate-binding domain-containing protein [Sulfitobacter sp. LCG007]
MPRTLPPLNALRAFEAAGRYENFTRAAEELRVSHSAISRHVRGLEDRLGTQLFREQSRGLVLTREGALFLERITPAFDAIAEATETVMARPAGAILVSSERVFALRWLVPRLAGFARLHPEIEVRIEASDVLADLARHEADLALRFLGAGRARTGGTLLSDAPLHPFAAPGLVELPLRNPRDLLRHTLLKDRNSVDWAQWFALAGKVAPDEVAEPAWRMEPMLAIESAVAGMGVVLCSAEVVAGDLASGRLVKISDIGIRDGGYYIVHADGALRRKPVRLFRDWLLDETADLRAGAA